MFVVVRASQRICFRSKIPWSANGFLHKLVGASSPLGVHFIMGLLSLAEDADGIVCPTSATRTGTVTLQAGVSASEQRTDAVILIFFDALE